MLIKLIKNVLVFQNKQSLDAKYWIQNLLLRKNLKLRKF